MLLVVIFKFYREDGRRSRIPPHPSTDTPLHRTDLSCGLATQGGIDFLQMLAQPLDLSLQHGAFLGGPILAATQNEPLRCLWGFHNLDFQPRPDRRPVRFVKQGSFEVLQVLLGGTHEVNGPRIDAAIPGFLCWRFPDP